MRLALLVVVLLTATHVSAQGTGVLAGQVLETDSVTTVIGARVQIEGTTLGGVADLDGNFRILGVPVGTYTVAASYVGYESRTITVVTLSVSST